MREPIVESPNLFDLPPNSEAVSESAAGSNPARVAGEFVRWLCGFGADFRNSPDRTNLRFWLRQQQIELQDSDEQAVIATARALLLKRVEQSVRKPEARPAGA